MKKSKLLINLFFVLLTFSIFGQVGTPFSVTSTDTSICEGQSTTLSVQSLTGTINALTCVSAIHSGDLFAGVEASNVSSEISYTGGNGGLHNGQIVTSTGVTGLTATLIAGVFSNGSGSLVYSITGTPSTVGTANFALNIGGQSCTLNISVYGTQPAYPAGSVFCNGVTIVNDVTNPTTGKTWMDRNLGASQVASSSTDANSYGDLYQWGRRSDGHQCRTSATTSTLSSVDQPAHGNFITNSVTPFDWRSPQNTNLWQGVNGVNNPCPSGYRLPSDTELDSERASWSSQNSSGAFASTLKLTMAGRRSCGNGLMYVVGSEGYYWSRNIGSNSSSRGIQFYSSNLFLGDVSARGNALSIRCIKETVGSIGALNCSSSTVTGNLIAGVVASGVSVNVPYSGGNGGFYESQSISSTGVTGLTAAVSQGSFINGSGSLVYSITGTPNSGGTANFSLNIGGQSCTLNITVYHAQPSYPSGSVFCNGTVTIVNDVTNPATGKTWMDRNLGASQVATSSTDAAAFGDLYQWGRRSDGHQCRTSATTSTLSSVDQPLHSSFILSTSTCTTAPYGDWRSPQNATLWQGVNGINNPCPFGYRLPTETEINAESTGAFVSPLKLPIAGERNYSTGAITLTNGRYWTSTVNTTCSAQTQHQAFGFNSSTGSTGKFAHSQGASVRCIKETVGSIDALNCSSSTVTGNLIAGVVASGVSVNVPYSGGNGGFYESQSISSTGVTGLTAAVSQGSFINGSGSLVYSITGTPSSIGTANFALNVGGQSCVLSISVAAGSITSISCTSATSTGSILAGITASGVTSVVPYSGGNGGLHSGQVVSSTGVIGLTATLPAGSFASGSGNLTYTLSGTASASGIANFAINIGGKSCTLSVIVYGPQPTYPSGTVVCNSITTMVNDVTSSTTGKIWMDRNLGATQVATSSSDANSFGDLYQWGRRSDGHQCRTSTTTATLSSVDQPAHGNFITNSTSPIDWRNPQNTNLWQGVNGVNNPCPSGYRLPTQTELSNENILQPTTSMTSEIKAPQGGYRSNTGVLTSVSTWGYYWTNTLSGTLSKYLKIGGGPGFYDFSRATGASVRCIKETVGTIGTLDCGSATVTGNVISGTAASGVSASVPYTGGNGGFYAAQSVSSSGVTGLTASLSQGLFASGAGSLVYTISGTPSGSGSANFTLNIGGKSCSLSIIVYGVQPAYPAGAVFCNGATIVNDVTNPTTGRTWMDRNLGATQAATSSTDANSFGDLYQWGRGVDGHQCRNSVIVSNYSAVSDQPGISSFILSFVNTPYSDWRNPQNNNLWQGVNGINNPCPNGYRVPTSTEMDAERLSWSNNNAVGAFSSPLKLPTAGDRLGSNGQLYDVGASGVYWSSTVSGTNSNYIVYGASSAGVYSIVRTNGYSIRCIKETIGSVGAINCGSSTVTGNLISGSAASGVSVSVPYTGGNGGYYAAQSISSTGVTGLTASISQGLFASGAGNLVYTISGTPSSDGTASFAISIGGQSCTLSIATLGSYYPSGSVFCASGPTVVKDVTNPTTGKTWMDRNLGASQVATSSTDAAAYGDLYQWGRGTDGHQCRNSTTTTILSSTDTPPNGSFITNINSPFDWRSPQNNNLWQGVNGINNPCPNGYRLPTDSEFINEFNSWNTKNLSGAFSSHLKFPASGSRWHTNGGPDAYGTWGIYWSSSISSTNSRGLTFNSSEAYTNFYYRASGRAVRCIKD